MLLVNLLTAVVGSCLCQPQPTKPAPDPAPTVPPTTPPSTTPAPEPAPLSVVDAFKHEPRYFAASLA